MASLDNLARRLERLSDRLVENRTKLVKKVAVTVDQAIVTATPVDSGRARSNWIVSIGAPVTAPIPAYSEGKGGSTAAANTAAATAQAQAVIGSYRGAAGQEIHITNNLPYIQKLNDGSSAQAPANFVESAINEGLTAVRNSNLLG